MFDRGSARARRSMSAGNFRSRRAQRDSSAYGGVAAKPSGHSVQRNATPTQSFDTGVTYASAPSARCTSTASFHGARAKCRRRPNRRVPLHATSSPSSRRRREVRPSAATSIRADTGPASVSRCTASPVRRCEASAHPKRKSTPTSRARSVIARASATRRTAIASPGSFPSAKAPSASTYRIRRNARYSPGAS